MNFRNFFPARCRISSTGGWSFRETGPEFEDGTVIEADNPENIYEISEQLSMVLGSFESESDRTRGALKERIPQSLNEVINVLLLYNIHRRMSAFPLSRLKLSPE